MTWTKPEIREIALNMEVTLYVTAREPAPETFVHRARSRIGIGGPVAACHSGTVAVPTA